MLRTRIALSFAALALVTTAAGCGSSGPPEPVKGHPRLFVTEKDVPRLREWARPSNPFYANGIEKVGKDFKAMMDGGHLRLDQDCIADDGFLICEWFAEALAFLSLVSPDAAEREDYALHAKTLLMHMIDA